MTHSSDQKRLKAPVWPRLKVHTGAAGNDVLSEATSQGDTAEEESKTAALEDYYLYAITTSQFYPRHLALAREQAPIAAWERHIEDVVLPLYGKEIGTTPDRRPNLTRLAQMLKHYYEQHVTEF